MEKWLQNSVSSRCLTGGSSTVSATFSAVGLKSDKRFTHIKLPVLMSKLQLFCEQAVAVSVTFPAVERLLRNRSLPRFLPRGFEA
jgi:hypothetical protein